MLKKRINATLAVLEQRPAKTFPNPPVNAQAFLQQGSAVPANSVLTGRSRLAITWTTQNHGSTDLGANGCGDMAKVEEQNIEECKQLVVA